MPARQRRQEIPDSPGNYWYVWFDAPIGYIASTRQWCERHGERLGEGSLGVPGRHNVQNSLAALAVALELGVSAEAAFAVSSGLWSAQRDRLVGRPERRWKMGVVVEGPDRSRFRRTALRRAAHARLGNSMNASLPLLHNTDFPALRRRVLDTLQVNLGYRCNQSCVHCHVNAGPNRKEMMDRETLELIPEVLEARGVRTHDLTGGAPELHDRDIPGEEGMGEDL